MKTYTLEELDKLFEKYKETLCDEDILEERDTDRRFVDYYAGRFLAWIERMEVTTA